MDEKILAFCCNASTIRGGTPVNGLLAAKSFTSSVVIDLGYDDLINKPLNQAKKGGKPLSRPAPLFCDQDQEP